MELRHLRYFVAVAEELHFGRAARRLHMSQPPLSQQVKRLEEELGVQLLHRTKRRVELTEAGEAFLGEASLALSQVEAAAEAARRAGRGETGTLSVGFVGSAAYEVLPEVLKAFRGRYPDVEIRLEELTTAQQVRALGEGRIEVGFVRPPVGEESLAVETVLREPLVAVLPGDHSLSEQEGVSLGALAEEPFVMTPRRLGPSFYDRIVGACREAGFSPRVVQEAIQMQTIIGMVAAGIGVALVPASESNLTRKGVVYKPIQDEGLEVELAMVWAPEGSSPTLRAFLSTVGEVSSDGCWHTYVEEGS
jgi:DNA-binding transcriptional LysR family regulator